MSERGGSKATVQALPTAEKRFLLEGVSWRFYEQFLEEVGGRPIRLTYDRGNLEVMSPLRLHELVGRFLGRLVETISLDLGIPIASCGSTTFRREDLARGLEPDECYYVGNEPRVRDGHELDLAHDPPPDLAIEVDITSSSLDRQGIYAALGVPELWRYDGEQFHLLHLQPDGSYAGREQSRSFPFLPHPAVVRSLEHLFRVRRGPGDPRVPGLAPHERPSACRWRAAGAGPIAKG